MLFEQTKRVIGEGYDAIKDTVGGTGPQVLAAATKDVANAINGKFFDKEAAARTAADNRGVTSILGIAVLGFGLFMVFKLVRV